MIKMNAWTCPVTYTLVRRCRCTACWDDKYMQSYLRRLINAKELLAQILLFGHNLEKLLETNADTGGCEQNKIVFFLQSQLLQTLFKLNNFACLFREIYYCTWYLFYTTNLKVKAIVIYFTNVGFSVHFSPPTLNLKSNSVSFCTFSSENLIRGVDPSRRPCINFSPPTWSLILQAAGFAFVIIWQDG